MSGGKNHLTTYFEESATEYLGKNEFVKSLLTLQQRQM